MESEYKRAHSHSRYHRQKVESSNICGCFYCCYIFKPIAIKEWVDEDERGLGTTALCPNCGIDSVLGDNSGYPITKEFLKDMNKTWFG